MIQKKVKIVATTVTLCGAVLLFFLNNPSNVQSKKTVKYINLDNTADISTDHRPAIEAPKLTVQSSDENPSRSDKIHPLFEEYQQLTPQEVLINLFKDSRAINNRVELILQLVEHGHIGINQPLREGANSTHYTPLFAAITSNNGQLSPEEFEQFIALGADIPPNKVWQRIFASLRITDESLIETWIDTAGIGPEQYDFLFQRSAIAGDGELAHYLLDQEQQFLYYQELLNTKEFEHSLNSSINFNIGKESKTLQFIKAQPNLDYPTELHRVIGHLEKRLQRSENWLEYAPLNDIQRANLRSAIVAMTQYLEQLNAEFLAIND